MCLCNICDKSFVPAIGSTVQRRVNRGARPWRPCDRSRHGTTAGQGRPPSRWRVARDVDESLTLYPVRSGMAGPGAGPQAVGTGGSSRQDLVPPRQGCRGGPTARGPFLDSVGRRRCGEPTGSPTVAAAGLLAGPQRDHPRMETRRRRRRTTDYRSARRCASTSDFGSGNA